MLIMSAALLPNTCRGVFSTPQRRSRICLSTHACCSTSSSRPHPHTAAGRHAPAAAAGAAAVLCSSRQLRSTRQRQSHVVYITPFDQAWGTQIDGQSLASQFFAMSLLPYLAFLFFLTRSGKAPRLMLGGFYFLLAFVGATIPAGIYAKTHYGTSLANVDWLHGSAESLLTITNLLIVLGLQQAIAAEQAKKAASIATQQQQQSEASAPEAVSSSPGPRDG